MKKYNDRVMEAMMEWGCSLEEAVQLWRDNRAFVSKSFIANKPAEDVAEKIVEIHTV